MPVSDLHYTFCLPVVVLLNVASTTTLGYTLYNGFWNDWDEFLIADFNNDGAQDFWYSTVTTKGT